MNSSSLSLAAASGITPSVAQTWFPGLVRTPRVLVPIQLEVLMVRDAGQQWANCQMTVPPPHLGENDPPPTPAASLLPQPFAELPAPRPRGAYLHWYLPRGLTAGVADDVANSLLFPAIPDRWLVLRLSPGRTALRRAVAGWVLEGGLEPPKCTPLSQWSEPGPATGLEKAPTALGHGDLAWAGYFDNVRNRLGFYDRSLDQEKVRGRISYLVCGWYADPASDPLGSGAIDSLAAFNATLQKFGWELDASQLREVIGKSRDFTAAAFGAGLEVATQAQYTTSGNWWPGGTLFHGSVVGIDWPTAGDTQEFGGPPDPASVHVAAGNTMAETMGALIASANGAPGEALIVAALQLGALSELDLPDGRARLDAQLHASSFASLSGGPATSEPILIAPSGPAPAAPANSAPPGPGVFASNRGGGASFAGVSGQAEAVGLVPNPRLAPRSAVGHLEVPDGLRADRRAEKAVAGGFDAILHSVKAAVSVPGRDLGGAFDAARATPRYYSPKDPIVLVQGGKRAFTHDSTVHTDNGMVVCRLTPVSELSWTMPLDPLRLAVLGEDILESAIGNGSVPLECEGLLQETALLDPGSAAAIAATAASRAAGGVDSGAAAQIVAVEQTAWYALRDPRIDLAPLLARSGIAGTLPAAFSIAPAARPWTPIHLDWQVEYLPSPGIENDWILGELDFAPAAGAAIPAPGSGLLLSGRSTLTGGAAATLGSTVQKALDDVTRISGSGPVPPSGIEAHFSDLARMLSGRLRVLTLGGDGAAPADSSDPAPVDPSLLSDIGTALAQMDVLSCGLDGIIAQLRGGALGDGGSTPPGGLPPDPFFPVRAGFLRLVRLRLVDGFGQFVDLCGSNATASAAGYLVSDTASVPGQALLLAQPPRFSAPARLWFRYLSASEPGVEADYERSPLCGFLMPNHLDGSLEFFNADGSGAGTLQPAGRGLVSWQGAPGLPTPSGQDPASVLANPYAAQLAASLIGWGVADTAASREPALSALLRTIDSTLWSVDPFGHQGEEHLSLLVGHPVCILRALLRLDVADPVVAADGTFAKIPVRLGSLTHWDDGLLGYFVNDDYTRLHAIDAAATGLARSIGPQQGFLKQINLVPAFYASFADDVAGNVASASATPGNLPVTHPYVDPGGILWILPNQTIYLTLLVEPLTRVYATAGCLPRKEIGMRRSWVHDGLAAISPTFRFGPVLVDPRQIRMPIASDLKGKWVWDHRADAVSWNENPVTRSTDDALMPQDPATASEGWLKLAPPPPKTPAP